MLSKVLLLFSFISPLVAQTADEAPQSDPQTLRIVCKDLEDPDYNKACDEFATCLDRQYQLSSKRGRGANTDSWSVYFSPHPSGKNIWVVTLIGVTREPDGRESKLVFAERMFSKKHCNWPTPAAKATMGVLLQNPEARTENDLILQPRTRLTLELLLNQLKQVWSKIAP